MRGIFKGSQNHSEYFVLVDSATGLPKTGIAFGSVTASYARSRSARVAITTGTLAAATTAFTSGGWFEVDSANMPGLYRFDVPDAAFVTGSDQVVVSLVVTGVKTESKEFRLQDVNDQDAVRFGLTALPNAAAEAAGGLYTRGTNAGQINQAANGMIDTNPVRLNNVSQSLLDLKDFADDGYDPSTDSITKIATGGIVAASFAAGAIDAAAIATDAIGSAELATSAVTEIQAAVAAGAVASVTGNVGGNVTGSVGSIASGGITTASFAAGAIDATAIATDAIGSAELAASAVTEIQSAVAAGAVASVTGNVGGNVVGSVGSVASGGITSASFAASAITATSIATDAITAAKIAADAIGASELATDAVTEIQAAVAAGAVASVTGNVGGNVVGSIGSLGATAKADVNAEVVDALTVDTYAELAAVPAATSSLKDKLNWLFALARNRITSTSTTISLRNDADGANIATSTQSDDSTTYVRGEFS